MNKNYAISAALSVLISAAGPFTPALANDLPRWSNNVITVSDQTHSRTPNGQAVHNIPQAVENYNLQQTYFHFVYTQQPCSQVSGPCWTVNEVNTPDYFAGRAKFTSKDGQMTACTIEMNSAYGSSVHVIMHEMFHCFGYADTEDHDNDHQHSDDPASIVSIVNNGVVALTDKDLAFLALAAPVSGQDSI